MGLARPCKSENRRLPLAISLRSLLFLITAFTLWFGWHVKRTLEQQRAVAAIENFGGMAWYDYQWSTNQNRGDLNAGSWIPSWLLNRLGVDYFHSVVAVNLAWSFDDDGKRVENSNLGGQVVEQVEYLPAVRTLTLQGAQANDDAMVHIAKLKNLTHLAMFTASRSDGWLLSRPTVTDLGVSKLGGLHQLRSIHIYDAYLTDKSLQHLSRCRKLEDICLQGNQFTDEGLRFLAGLHRLRKLWLGQTRGVNISNDGLKYLDRLENLEVLALGGRISDDGIMHLMPLANLAEIYLTSNEVSDSGKQRLATAFPEANIFIGEHIPNHAENLLREMRFILAHLTDEKNWQTIEPNTKLVALFPEKNQRSDALKKLQASFNGLYTVAELSAFTEVIMKDREATVLDMAEELARQRQP